MPANSRLVTNVTWAIYDFAHGLPAQGVLMGIYAGLALYGFHHWRPQQ